MTQFTKQTLAAAAFFAFVSFPVIAQSPKELKTKSGASVVVLDLLNAKSDCSANPGSVAVPFIREKPTNGIIQLQVIATNVPAENNCPARRVPTIAVIYTPKRDFVGTDSVQIEIEVGNRTTALSYRIIVQSIGEPL